MKRALFALASCALALGCVATYSHTDITEVSSNELPATIDQTGIRVVHGGVVTANIEPYNSDNKRMVGGVSSSDPTILQVLPAFGTSNYAFLGVKPGKTTVEFKSDGIVVATVEAEVLEQTPP